MSLVGQLIGPVTGLLDKFIPDADTKNKLAHEIATMSEKHGQTEGMVDEFSGTANRPGHRTARQVH